jgi:hypothetical protein
MGPTPDGVPVMIKSPSYNAGEEFVISYTIERMAAGVAYGERHDA